MDVEDDVVANKIGSLNDIALALLLCLINGEHCIIRADPFRLDQVQTEVAKACHEVFGLTVSNVECSPKTTLDSFVTGVLTDSNYDDDLRCEPGAFASIDRSGVAEVVIARDLHLADKQVQTQALELIRGKRIFTRTEVLAVPKRFFFCVILPDDREARLIPLLNDQLFLSHRSYEDDSSNRDDARSDGSVSPFMSRAGSIPELSPLIDTEVIEIIRNRASQVHINAEIRAYLHNIIVFLRLHRAVAGGITAQATKHFLRLSHALAALHNSSFISPSHVALAARKIYPHRIAIITPEGDRSLQWGSSIEAVEEYLDDLIVEDVVEDVLGTVQTPL